ncbi:fibronectin type III domain-containing protein [bacterium]|nr:fibronectin type III domain-containing protein [bacterium]
MTKVFVISIVLTFVILTPASCIDNPITNPSFESGLTGWTAYAGSTNGALPTTGCIGSSPCVFDIFASTSAPDGSNVCGLQSLYPTDPPKNGGVYQVFTWGYGFAEITISGRAYSEGYDTYLNWGPLADGCSVSVGLADFSTSDRNDASQWSSVYWGDYDPWQTATVYLYGSGTYTLFIENAQLEDNATVSSLWDNVSIKTYINITSGPTVNVGDDPNRPDTTARIEWTTDIPSKSRVDYGLDTNYGSYVQDDTLTTDHSLLLENLNPSSQYHFIATSTAPNAYDTDSGDCTFDLPICFSNISVATEGLDTIIKWNTDVASTSQVEYGKTTSYGSTSDLDTELTTEHEVHLTGLDENSDYHFRVWASRSLYTSVHSDDQTFHTYPDPVSSLENSSFENDLSPWVLYQSSITGSTDIDGRIGPYPSSGTQTWSSAQIKAYDGSYFIGAQTTSEYKNGGVFQRLYWSAGQLCTLCARFATQNNSVSFYDTEFRLGIDPDGGVDPTDSDIVWWTGFSPTNNNQWHTGGVTATAGSGGIVTVFLDVVNKYSEEHVVALDDATFGAPVAMSIGNLKEMATCTGAEIQDALVTAEAPSVSYTSTSYPRRYIQCADIPAGIAVLFDTSRGTPPSVGDKVTIKGAPVYAWKEATLFAYDWTTTQGPFTLPDPLGMSQKSIGGSACNQIALYASQYVCNVGSRVRLWGKVTDSNYDYTEGAQICQVDDGTGLVDPYGGIKGVRVKVIGGEEVATGDYLMATGVLSIEHIDPYYPHGSSTGEYDVYRLITNSASDWTCIPAEE